jgi:hypothetical protein
MCILFHKWKPHYKLERTWIQFTHRVFPSLFSGPPYLVAIPGIGRWTNKKLIEFRCTWCGKRKPVYTENIR